MLCSVARHTRHAANNVPAIITINDVFHGSATLSPTKNGTTSPTPDPARISPNTGMAVIYQFNNPFHYYK